MIKCMYLGQENFRILGLRHILDLDNSGMLTVTVPTGKVNFSNIFILQAVLSGLLDWVFQGKLSSGGGFLSRKVYEGVRPGSKKA